MFPAQFFFSLLNCSSFLGRGYMSTCMVENGRKIHAKKENCFELTCETSPFAEPTSCVSSSGVWYNCLNALYYHRWAEKALDPQSNIDSSFACMRFVSQDYVKLDIPTIRAREGEKIAAVTLGPFTVGFGTFTTGNIFSVCNRDFPSWISRGHSPLIHQKEQKESPRQLPSKSAKVSWLWMDQSE